MLLQTRDYTRKYGTMAMIAALAGCSGTDDTSVSSRPERSPSTDDETNKDDFQIDDAKLRASVGSSLDVCEGIEDACRSDGGHSEPSEECKSEVHGCLTAVVERALAFFSALHECQKTAEACVAEDDADRKQCRDDFGSCIESAFEGGGSGTSGDAGADDDASSPKPDGGVRRDAGTRSSSGGGTRSPVSSIDAGAGRSSGSGGGLSSEECITELQACTERSGSDPEACQAAAAACVESN